MVTINLFPWRKEKQIYESKVVYIASVLTLITTISFMAAIHRYLAYRQDGFQEKIIKLSSSLKDISAKKASFSNSFSVLSEEEKLALDKEKLLMHKLFSGISKKNQTAVCFNNIEKSKDIIIFAGKAGSMFDLSALLQYWQYNQIFSQINIESLEKKGDILFFRVKVVA